MTNEQAREVFNQVIQQVADKERIARLEVIREYFTNDEFRKALENHVYELTR